MSAAVRSRGRRRSGRSLHGVLPVDKPVGPTSFFVVGRLKARTGAAKTGHAGTLDPMASGLLLVCFGEATKAVPWLMDAPKSYLATLRLGVVTDTDDAEGEILRERPVEEPSEARVREELGRFRGTIPQVPPLYSALKRGGERLYEKARRGERIELAPRPVVVHEIGLESIGRSELTLRVRCGKGFYVRALARDLGEALGCGAHLSALRRTESARFCVRDAVALDRLLEPDESWRERLVPPSRALGHLPALSLSAEETTRISHGHALTSSEPWSSPLGDLATDEPARLLDPEGRLLAIGQARSEGDGWTLRVLRGFNLPSAPSSAGVGPEAHDDEGRPDGNTAMDDDRLVDNGHRRG